MVFSQSTRSGASERLGELYTYRELLWNLTLRDLRLKYKGSALGIVWSLLNPLLMMAIYTVVFGFFLRVGRSTPGHPYWALIIGGVLAWTFFANSLSQAVVAYVRNPSLISKVYFPIETLPISMVLANLVNFVIPLAILIVALLVAHVPLGPSLILLPVLVLAQVALTVGLALAVSALTVFFRDVEHLLGLGLQLGFYLTPVLYPLDPKVLGGAGRFIVLLKLNPLSWYLESYHSILYYGTWPDPLFFALVLISAAIALVGGYAVFLRLRNRLPEEV